MLTSTFIHVPGVGGVTERSLWRQGIETWQDYLQRSDELSIPVRHKPNIENTILESMDALADRRADYFARKLTAREHWRAVVDFPKLGFLDIETDGGTDKDSVTLIGLYDGYETKLYTKGINLAEFAYDSQDFDGFVTFFGSGFDVPFLKRRFPVMESVFADRFHIDLCPLFKILGYKGGLKSIERQFGIARIPEADGLSGLDAVRLWRTYKMGGDNAEDSLRLLQLYNTEDVVNMKTLLDIALPKIRMRTGIPKFMIPK